MSEIKKYTNFWNRDSILSRLIELEQMERGSPKFKVNKDKFVTEACEYFGYPQHIIDEIFKEKNDAYTYNIIWKYLREHGLNDPKRDYSFLSPNRHSPKKKKAQEQYVFVHPLSPTHSGFLPARELYTSKCAYVFHGNRPYLLTLSKGFHDDEKEFYSEQKWVSKNTVVLMGSSILALKHGWFDFQLDEQFSIDLKINSINLKNMNPKNISKVKERIDFYEFMHTNIYHEKRLHENNEFEFRHDLDLKRFREIVVAIDTNNGVLMRCLYNFTKSCCILHQRMIMEEATALQFFAIEGLINLMMKKYRIKSHKDFWPFLWNKFKCPYGEYLEEIHDERTIYVHPSNRFGDYWCPPWDADTCYETVDITKELFSMYLLEKFEPDFTLDAKRIKELDAEYGGK